VLVTNQGPVEWAGLVRINVHEPKLPSGKDGPSIAGNPDQGRIYLKPGASDIVRMSLGLPCAGGMRLGDYEVAVGLSSENPTAGPCAFNDHAVYDERNRITVLDGSICQGFLPSSLSPQ
jgi:hypothetical protein